MKEKIVNRFISEYSRLINTIARVVNQVIPGAVLCNLYTWAKEKNRTNDVFEYSVGKITLPVKIESLKHLVPEFATQSIDKIELICSACGKINPTKWYTQKIPLEKSIFKMELHVIPLGTNQPQWVSAVHIDGIEPNPVSAEVHPLFHVQYVNESKTNNFEALSMDVPRLAHYPVDVISGLDIAIRNYLPEEYKKIILKGDYASALREIQLHCILPYFRELAQFHDNKDFAKLLCPYLV